MPLENKKTDFPRSYFLNNQFSWGKVVKDFLLLKNHRKEWNIIQKLRKKN